MNPPNPPAATILDRLTQNSNLAADFAKNLPAEADLFTATLELLQHQTFETQLHSLRHPNNYKLQHLRSLIRLMTEFRHRELQLLRHQLNQEKLDLQAARQSTPASPHSNAPPLHPPPSPTPPDPDPEPIFVPRIDPLPSLRQNFPKSPAHSNPPPLHTSPAPSNPVPNSTANAPTSATTSDLSNPNVYAMTVLSRQSVGATTGRIRISASRAAREAAAAATPAKPSISPEVPGLPGVLQTTLNELAKAKYEILKDNHITWKECEQMALRQLQQAQKVAAQEKAEAENKARHSNTPPLQPPPAPTPVPPLCTSSVGGKKDGQN